MVAAREFTADPIATATTQNITARIPPRVPLVSCIISVLLIDP
jgi:hypothetical protein